MGQDEQKSTYLPNGAISRCISGLFKTPTSCLKSHFTIFTAFILWSSIVNIKEVSADNWLYLSAAENQLQKCAADNLQINFPINQQLYLFINMTSLICIVCLCILCSFDERI